MDYVGVKTFDANGAFNGERRFVGLFTSSAYSLSPREIPLLRQKCAAVMTRAGFAPASHDGKALAHILDTFPRDELFQISEDELFEIAMGILRLGGRPKVKLFLRFDRFDRFVSALVFAPARSRQWRIAREDPRHPGPRLERAHCRPPIPAIDESALVRIHYIIGRNQGPRPQVDVRALEREIADAIRTWDDAFLEALSARHGRAEGLRRLTARAAQFTPGYRGSFSAHEAAADLDILETLAAREDGLKVEARAYRKADDAHSALRLKLYVLGEVLPLVGLAAGVRKSGPEGDRRGCLSRALQARRWLDRGRRHPGLPDGARRRRGCRTGRYPQAAARRVPRRAGRGRRKATASTGW